MAGCEKCWGEAFDRSYCSGRSQTECYQEILKERNASGKICTPQEQAGDWWDEKRQCDSRDIKVKE